MADVMATARQRPPRLAEELLVRCVAQDTFEAPGGPPDRHGLYGGRLMAHTMAVVVATLPGRRQPTGLHARFVRPADPTKPLHYEVARLHDGAHYSARRVDVTQDGRLIAFAEVTCHTDEPGPDHAEPQIPAIEDPERLPDVRPTPRVAPDVRFRVPSQPSSGQQVPTRLWVNTMSASVPWVPFVAYVSDLFSGIEALPQLRTRAGVLATVTHELIVHRQGNPAEWMLIDLRPESVGQGRAAYIGRAHARSGQLLATWIQQSTFRPPNCAETFTNSATTPSANRPETRSSNVRYTSCKE